MKKRKKRIYIEAEVECPNCKNLLLEIVELPKEICRSEDDNLLVAKRIGYYCQECNSKFSPNLKFDDDSL